MSINFKKSPVNQPRFSFCSNVACLTNNLLLQTDAILVVACRSLACRSLVNRALFSSVGADAATIK